MENPSIIVRDSEALTWETLKIYMDRIYREKHPEVESFPKQCIDLNKIHELGIRFFFDAGTNMYLTSASEMRRAKEGGAIWYEDENGNRV